jgi:DNA-binding CsgD family transcriptional regulator
VNALADALDHLYEAAVDGRLWPDALDRLAAGLGARGCVLLPRAQDLLGLGIPAGGAIQDVLAAFVTEGWQNEDVRTERIWPWFDRGEAIVVDHDVIAGDERARSAYFQEFAAAHDVPWGAAYAFRAAGRQWCVGLLRSRRDGPFRREEMIPASAISPHVSRAVTLAARLRRVAEHRSIEVLEATGLAAVALDGRGRASVVTHRARAILSGGDLRFRHGQLSATEPSNDRLLQGLIRRAVSAAGPHRQEGADTVVLERHGRRPLVARAISLPATLRDVFARDVAILVLSDTGAGEPVPAQLLREAFGLTPAEAEVAVRIAGGGDPRSVADDLGVSPETVRGHLKKVFAKTDTARQSELAILVNRFGGA